MLRDQRTPGAERRLRTFWRLWGELGLAYGELRRYEGGYRGLKGLKGALESLMDPVGKTMGLEVL